MTETRNINETLAMVPLASIIVSDRYRKDYGDITDLIVSIKEKGVISPLAVDGKMNLLAGGRRHKACTEAKVEIVPVIIKTVLSKVDALEIEYDENKHRKQLEWKEEAELLEAIDNAKKSEDPSWSQRKTAAFVGESIGKVSQDIQLAKAARAIPEIAKAKTKDEAQKKMDKLYNDLILGEFARREKEKVKAVTASATAGAKRTAELFDNYAVGDCTERLPNLPDKMFDLASVDSPYAVDLNRTKATTRGSNQVNLNLDTYEEITPEQYPALMSKVAGETYRVLKDDTWCIWWFGIEWYEKLKAILTETGFKVDVIPCIWIKDRGQTNRPDKKFGRAYETFFLCAKGNPILFKEGRLNVFDYPIGDASKKDHATEKPLELMKDLFSCLAIPGAKIVSPFLGSGVDIQAALLLDMTCLGYDKSEEHRNRFIARMTVGTERPKVEIKETDGLALMINEESGKLEFEEVDDDELDG